MEENYNSRGMGNNPGGKNKLLSALFSSSVLNFLLILILVELAIYLLVKSLALLAIALPVTLIAFIAYFIYVVVKRPTDIPKDNRLAWFTSVLFWIFVITLLVGVFAPWVLWLLLGGGVLALIFYLSSRY